MSICSSRTASCRSGPVVDIASRLHQDVVQEYTQGERFMSTNIRRVVTGHDASGKAIVISDGQPPKKRDMPAIEQALLWVTDKTPASNAGNADGGNTDVGIPPPTNGSIFRVID